MTTTTSSAPDPATKRRERYLPNDIEQHWQQAWVDADLYRMPSGAAIERKWYQVTMYPYPSGDLHIGHWYSMAPPDAMARYKRMSGYQVFFPMGFDAFGLPAENAAIKRGIHPHIWTMANIDNMRRQMRSMGTMFDWRQEIVTCLPEFYIWNQWFFLKFLEAGLAYRKNAAVWWCPGCQTVLANEQVVDGRCERSGDLVIRRDMEQWFFKITNYADELLSYAGIEWPEPVRNMQRNWIGRSEGARVSFTTETGDEIEVFTTRPDTLWGATFMVLAPEHALVEKLTTPERRAAVEAYIDHARRESDIERQAADKEKTGEFTGGYATNPVNGERIPVWIADYVLVTYGTGAIMAVPAHDERDFAFALKFGLPIVPVIERADGLTRSVVPGSAVRDMASFQNALSAAGLLFTLDGTAVNITATREQADDFTALLRADYVPGVPVRFAGARTGCVFGNPARVVELTGVAADRDIVTGMAGPERTAMELLHSEAFFIAEPDITFHHGYGTMINSGELSGTPGDQAVARTIAWLEERGIGRGDVTYRMRDWLISRQRYWGTPFPIIYCADHGAVPVPYEDLPVVLPEDSQFKPTGESPLKSDPNFLNAPCPICGKPGQRESDTMDTFMDSSWYWYRYLSPHDDARPFDPALAARWLPVDLYTGGIEHATMHLLYARFFTKAMRDIGMTDVNEPFTRLFNQGIILGEDGEKMSKSRGNVVDPDDLVVEYGADAVRLFLMFLGPWDQGGPWNSRGISGPRRFLDRAYAVVNETASNAADATEDDATRALRRVTHQTIRAVTRDFETFQYNTMVAHLMEFVNELMRLKDSPVAQTAAWREALLALPLLLAPGAPHIAEELWTNRLGQPFSVHQQPWPTWSEDLAAEDTVEIVVQVNGKLRERLRLPAGVSETDALAAARAATRIAEQLSGAVVVKEIYVPGRLINFVVR